MTILGRELEPLVCSSDLRQVFPCQSVDARVMATLKPIVASAPLKRDRDLLRLSRVETYQESCGYCAEDPTCGRLHEDGRVQPCSNLAELCRGIPGSRLWRAGAGL
jgi:hypothetical protein